MDPALDNRMILGGIGNLRLAPHVREGRPVTSVGRVPRPAQSSVPPEGSAPTPAARARGFVPQEKVTISAAAHSALASPDAVPADPADTIATASGDGGTPAPPVSSEVVPPRVASAYAASSQTTAPAGPSPAAPSENALFA